jgi:hypothetical protein
MNVHYYPLFAFRWRPRARTSWRGSAAQAGRLRLDKPPMFQAGMWSAALPPYPAATPDDQLRYVALPGPGGRGATVI